MRKATFMLMLVVLAGCSSYRERRAGGIDRASVQNTSLEQEAQEALRRFKQKDPTLQPFFERAYAYAIFPDVTKGGAGIGVAHGKGLVYRQDEAIGYTSLTQGTLGAQLGGQTFRQLIFFEDEIALNRFRRGNMEFSARASAVAASKGAARDADYAEGVAVFTMTTGGLLFDASIGGQSFTYTPLVSGTEPQALEEPEE